MTKEGHIDNSVSSVKNLRNNLVLYLPDLIYFGLTAILAVAFVYFNNLTHLLSGDLFGSYEVFKSITSSRSLFAQLVVSLVVVLLINVVIGLSTLATKLALIKNITNNEKISFYRAYKEAKHYTFKLLGLKLVLFLFYLVPAVILLGIGWTYRPLLLLMAIILIFVWIFYRFLFLFIYPALYSKTGKGIFRTFKDNFDYFNKNKPNVFLTGIIILVVNILIWLLITFATTAFNLSFSLNFLDFTSIGAIVFLVVKTLVDITVGLWSLLFIFRNY